MCRDEPLKIARNTYNIKLLCMGCFTFPAEGKFKMRISRRLSDFKQN